MIPSNITRIRGFRLVKQGELAKSIGMTHSRLSYIEAGERPASDEDLEAICDALDVPREMLDVPLKIGADQ